MEHVSLKELMSFDNLLHSDKFPENPFELLGKNLTAWLEIFIKELGCNQTPVIKGHVSEGATILGQVYVAEGAKVEPTAFIQGPAYIGPDSQIRHGAYIRGSVYVGKKCVVGHTTEAKGAVFFDHAKAGHFAYIGDSILCRNVNLGAGTKLANLKLKNNEVSYKHPKTQKKIASGLRKFSALIGENVQTGCNSVLSPGSILMANTGVYPCVHFHGTLTEGFAKK